MARIRTIKPEFWSSEQVVECSTTARLLFVGMWNFADDGGVIPDSTKTLKMQIFPGDSFSITDIESYVNELVSVGLLKRFTVKNRLFLLITGWHHQKIDKPSYRYPQPDSSTQFDDHSATIRRVLDDHSPPEGKGMEGSLKERKGSNLSASETRSERKIYSGEFEKFWLAFPNRRRTKKSEAYRKWKLALKLADAEMLISKATEYANSELGRSDYAVMPSVWLSGSMWEDDPEAWRCSRSSIEKPKPEKPEGAVV